LSGSHFKPPALPVVYDWNSRSILIYIIAKTVSIVKHDTQGVSNFTLTVPISYGKVVPVIPKYNGGIVIGLVERITINTGQIGTAFGVNLT
jgi:hypothetical protein